MATLNARLLESTLEEYSKNAFKNQYGFEFQARAPDQHGNMVQRYSALVLLSNFTRDVVKEFVEDEMFRPDSSGPFPSDISATVFDSIVDRITRCGEKNNEDYWGIEAEPIQYGRGDPSKNNVKEYSVLVYANGIHQNGDERVPQPIVYYMAYFCAVESHGL